MLSESTVVMNTNEGTVQLSINVVPIREVRRTQHPKQLSNIITYIVGKYGRRNGVVLPQSAGGIAFANALKSRGIVVAI
jgi:hypothetical protein